MFLLLFQFPKVDLEEPVGYRNVFLVPAVVARYLPR
jgi:hypothetical protein